MCRGFRIRGLDLKLFKFETEAFILLREQRPEPRVNGIEIELAPALINHRWWRRFCMMFEGILRRCGERFHDVEDGVDVRH